jgi:SAM-dependent methyltransferase
MDSIYTDGTYLKNNPQWHVDDSAWKAEHVATMLERHAISPASVAEVGCGAGEVLRELSLRLGPSSHFVGYEISSDAYRLCAHKSNGHIAFRLADLLEERAQYDVVMAIDVFEHVEDPFTFLRKLRVRGRHKIFHIPLELSALTVARAGPLLDARRKVGHLHHYSRETALATLEDCGYGVIDHFYTSGRTELGKPGWKTQALKWPRKALFSVAPDAAARLLGGYSLLVLAE